jgi:hypothetical protein
MAHRRLGRAPAAITCKARRIPLALPLVPIAGQETLVRATPR